MKNRLKRLELSSVDLVRAGANQKADICLFKSAQPPMEQDIPIDDRTFLTYTGALAKSILSIQEDDELNSGAKAEMVQKSFEQFQRAVAAFAPGEPEDDPEDDPIMEPELEEIQEIEKSAGDLDHIVEIEKFNPYHGTDGRFSAADGAGSFTYAPGKSEAHDKAIQSAKAKDFHKNISAAKASNDERDRWRVDVHDEKDYISDKLHVSKGGSTIAVESNGNIVSVCHHPGDTETRGRDLLKWAIENGGDRLDAFGENLFNFYTRNGFEPVSYTKFDERYAPEGWAKGVDAPEPVIFYKYTGAKGTMRYNEFLSSGKEFADYDTAYAARDNEIGGTK